MLTIIFFCLFSALVGAALLRVAQRWGKPTPEHWACANAVAQALRNALRASQTYSGSEEHAQKQAAMHYFSRLCAEVGPAEALKLVLTVGLSGELLSESGPEAVIREMANLLGVADEVLWQARAGRGSAPSRAVVAARR